MLSVFISKVFFTLTPLTQNRQINSNLLPYNKTDRQTSTGNPLRARYSNTGDGIEGGAEIGECGFEAEPHRGLPEGKVGLSESVSWRISVHI